MSTWLRGWRRRSPVPRARAAHRSLGRAGRRRGARPVSSRCRGSWPGPVAPGRTATSRCRTRGPPRESAPASGPNPASSAARRGTRSARSCPPVWRGPASGGPRVDRVALPPHERRRGSRRGGRYGGNAGRQRSGAASLYVRHQDRRGVEMGDGRAAPTTSVAISSASASVEAGRKPRRRTAAGSPPTTMTRPGAARRARPSTTCRRDERRGRRDRCGRGARTSHRWRSAPRIFSISTGSVVSERTCSKKSM